MYGNLLYYSCNSSVGLKTYRLSWRESVRGQASPFSAPHLCERGWPWPCSQTPPNLLLLSPVLRAPPAAPQGWRPFAGLCGGSQHTLPTPLWPHSGSIPPTPGGEWIGGGRSVSRVTHYKSRQESRLEIRVACVRVGRFRAYFEIKAVGITVGLDVG